MALLDLDHLNTQEMFDDTVRNNPYRLRFIPDHFKTQEMCDDAFGDDPGLLEHVNDHFKNKRMCEKVVEDDPWQLKYAPDQYKTHGMCDKVVRGDSSTLQFVPDWFFTQQQMDVWYDDNYCYHDDEIIEWHEGYEKRMTQKAKIKEELASIASSMNTSLKTMIED